MTQPYIVHWESIERAFPPGSHPPRLLRDVATWLGAQPWGSVGCFDLVGSFSDDAPILHGSALRREFALFIRLPDGSNAGYWYRTGEDPLHAPIVGLGSEGQATILADSLEAFLARLACNGFRHDNAWGDLVPHEDVEDRTRQLAAWLRQRLAVEDIGALAVPAVNRPDFGAHMDAWLRTCESHWGAHPVAIALSRLLTAYRPTRAEAWNCTHFVAAIVGTSYALHLIGSTSRSIPESAAAEPLLRAMRTHLWQRDPNMGLWFSATLRLYADGTIMPSFNYEHQDTDFGTSVVDPAQARADLVRAPRPARWVPSWLNAR